MFRFNRSIGEHSDSHWIGVSFDIPRERAKGSGFGGSLFVFDPFSIILLVSQRPRSFRSAEVLGQFQALTLIVGFDVGPI